MSRYIIAGFTIIPTTIACLFLSSCSSDKQVSYESGGVKQTISQGKDSLPADFQLPVYPGAQPFGSIEAVSQNKNDDDMSSYAMLVTNDSLEKVSGYYQRELNAQGWKSNETKLTDSISFDVKKNSIEGNILISLDKNKTIINLSSVKVLPDNFKAPESTKEYKPNMVTPATD